MKVLGIDPGLGRVGWAVVEREGSKESLVNWGCIETKAKSPTPERLLSIHKEVRGIISKYKPEEVAIEELFFFNNAKTVMAVGMGRGVVVLAAAEAKLPIFHYTPLQVKSTVGGYGNADKKQVEFMVKQLLHLKESHKTDDVNDAAGVALTHLAMRGSAFRRVLE